MKLNRYLTLVSTIAVLLGISLNAYTWVLKADTGFTEFHFGMILWSCTPYALCLAIIYFGRSKPALGFCSTILSLIRNISGYCAVFVKPSSSTAAIGLLFDPFVSLLVCIPIGMLVGVGMDRMLRRWTAAWQFRND
jgi:hypothetical protein